jgi:hypothetical protein
MNPPISFSRRPLAQDYCMSSDAANPTAKHASINGTAANTTNTASTIGGGGGSRMQDSFVYASKRDRRESPDRLSLRGRSSEVVRLRQSSGGGSTTGTGATKSKVSSSHSGKCRPASRSRKKSTKGADREVMLKLGKEERSVHALEAELEYVQEDRVQLMERYSRCKARCEELEQVPLSRIFLQICKLAGREKQREREREREKEREIMCMCMCMFVFMCTCKRDREIYRDRETETDRERERERERA